MSRQVKKLERHLGAALFLRDTNRVELTDYAKAILPATTLAFENINQSIEVASRARSVSTTGTCPPGGSSSAKTTSPTRRGLPSAGGNPAS